MESFKATYDAWLEKIEQALPFYLSAQPENEGGRVVEAARYSLLGGGKRIRPVLCLATAALLDVATARALPYACAIEMIHTYSLIHDDLPCMDDDQWRRGRKTCHVVYGEAMAVLAGDALLNRAYEILFDTVESGKKETVQAAAVIAQAAGSRGMIGGQVLDLTAAQKKLDSVQQETLHRMKTGALLKAPVRVALALSQARPQTVQDLETFADAIGLAFQIQDDILDETSSLAQLGKTTGKDWRDQKATYVSQFGLEGARTQLSETIETGKAALHHLSQREGKDTAFLAGLCQYLKERTS